VLSSNKIALLVTNKTQLVHNGIVVAASVNSFDTCSLPDHKTVRNCLTPEALFLPHFVIPYIPLRDTFFARSSYRGFIFDNPYALYTVLSDEILMKLGVGVSVKVGEILF